MKKDLSAQPSSQSNSKAKKHQQHYYQSFYFYEKPIFVTAEAKLLIKRTPPSRKPAKFFKGKHIFET